jgi:actin related protein 2/3 complex subunit 1A/1B
MIKKHKSTIVTAAWSPNSRLLVTASTDMKCRIVSAFDKNLDARSPEYDEVFGDKQYVFGEVLAEFDNAKAWVNTVAWSPNGRRIAFFGHGSTAHFVDLDAGVDKVQTLFIRDLPMLSAEFIDDNTIVAAGFDKNPAFFVNNGSEWTFKSFAEKESDVKAASAATTSNTSRAFAMFQQADSQGKKFGATDAPSKADFTTHKNTITCLRLDGAKKFTTSGLDGRVTYWDAAKYL